ncbi:DUF4347 domain-containing protein [Ferruginivarius sediminum]|uniref:DUF4347 domain-containing protein n=2 Tax=Ferruginivarius sediminum TaxID=2661937 RepID=A0A369TCJ8_9PROT|nr:DUF4347 domain-containing protein [Ferruginivarius sediminum]
MRRDSRRAAGDASRHGVSGSVASERHDSALAGNGLPAESLTALALEPRLLLDAAAAATGAEAAQQDDDGAATAPDDGGSSAPKDAGDAAPGDAAAARALAELGENGGRNEIVFVDTSVQDWQTLVDGVDPSAEVVFIGKGQDGLSAMADAVRGRDDIDAVHIVSHGYAGGLYLGRHAVTSNDLGASADDLRVFGNALSDDADILIYGCNVAQGEAGAAFVDRLSALTGADVGASTDMTGTDDWDFEYNAGVVESGSAFSAAAMTGFGGSLATIVVDSTADTIAADGVTTFREAIQQADGTAADDTIVFDAGIAGQTISLSNDVTDRGLGDFFDQGSLTIDGDADGDGQADITIDGGGNQGLIFTANDEILSIKNITLTNFQDQSGSNLGGAVHVQDLDAPATPIDVTFTNVTFTNNRTIGNGDGGAFSLVDVGAVSIDGIIVEGNSSERDGGGGSIRDYTSISIFDSEFINNSAQRQAGGLKITGDNSVDVSNSLFVKNTVSGGDAGVLSGGGLMLDGVGSTTFENVTIADNNVTNSGGGTAVGGGIILNAQTVSLENTLISGNTTDDTDPNVSGTATNVNGSSLIGGSVAFVDSANDDYRLAQTDTDAIDQGDNSLVDAALDIRGVDRIRQGEVDIGAFESPFDFVSSGVSNPGTAPDADLNGADGGGNDFTTAFSSGVNIVDSDATLIQGDSDTTLTSLTATITNVQDAGQETLSLTAMQVTAAAQNGITVSGNNSATLTLSGGAALTDYQTVLRQIVYDNAAGSPTGASRDIDVQANDDLSGTVRTATISFNAPPQVTTTGGSAAFAEDGGAIAVDAGLTVSEPDGENIDSATVSIQGGVLDAGAETLAVTDQLGITSSYDGTTGVLTLSGTTTAANYQTVLRTLTYNNTAQAPDTATRTISITTTDAQGSTSSAATRDVTVDSAPDITQVAVADGTYGIGDDIDVTVTFDGNVTVDTAGGTPSVDIVIDGNTRQADFVSVAGADATFRYTVADGDTGAGNDTDGVDVAANSLALNGGTIADADGDTADLTHAAANDGGETVDAHIAAPSVTSPISGDGVVNAGEAGSISVSVTGAEAGATVNLSISSSGGGGPVTAMGAADGSGNITFNAVDLGALTDGTLTISATQTDGAGNTSTAGTAGAQLDTAAPTVGTPDIVAGSDTGVSNSDDLTSDTTPSIDVSASDTLSGVPDGTTVAIDVDLDNDGDFTDPGEAGYATGTLSGGAVTIDLPALADGSYRARARVTDVAGNEGTSGVLTFDVDSTDPVLNGSLSLFENEGPGDTAGTVGLTDASNTTFALNDDAGGRFQIDANTGAVTVTAGTSFDAETEASIPITVQATDDAGNSATQVFNIAINNVNEAPVIGGVAGETSGVVAGTGATAVSGLGDATLADVDSADFSGGTLTIAQNAGTANGSWGLDGTTATSGGDGTMAAGETVSVGGVAIGTVNAVNDGQGGNTLTLDLGANATPARLQTLLQAMTYDAPSGLGTRDFTLTVVDNDGIANGGDEDASAAFTIDVTPNPPVLSGLDGESRTYAEGAAAVLLDSGGDATVTDADSADFDGGALTVSITAGGAAAEDVLEIVDNGAISVTGTEVFFDPGGGPVKIGDIAGGTGGADLVVTLNANAKPGDGSVDALLRAVAYRNTDGDSPTTGTRTVEVTVSDAAAGSNPATSAVNTVSVDVTGVNDAPTLAGGPFDLGTTDEDTTTGGTAVSAILAGLTAGDVDAGASSGVAVVASTGNGTWQFSTDGGTTWSDLGAVSDANARLLDTAAQLRYVPDGENGETATLDVRAWDQTTGAVGGVADASSNGGTAAFSTGTATASLTVDGLNDAPTLAGGPFDLGTTDEDTTTGGTAVSAILAGLTADDVDAGASSGIAVVASTGNGTWQFSTDGGTTWSDLGAVSDANARLLDAAAQLRYVPDGENGETATLDVRAWDQTTGAVGGVADASSNGGATAFSAGTATASLTVDSVNDAPTTTGATTLNIAEDGTVTLTTADFNFTDIDAGDALNGVRIDVAPSDGTLFVDGNGDGSAGAGETLTAGSVVAQADIDAGRLKYRPDANFNGSDSLAYTVRDSGGTFAAAQTNLTIQVAAVNDAPMVEGQLADQTAAIGEELSFQLPAGIFDDIEDSGALTLSASRADGSALPGWLSFDAATRTFSGEPGDGDTGSFQVRVTAEDSGGATASTTFAVTVESGTTAPPAIEVLNRGPVRIALVETAEGTAQVAFAENVSGNGVEAVLGSLNRGNSPLSRSFADSASESGPANEVFEAALGDPRTSLALQRLAGEADQALIYEDGAWRPLDLETLLGLGGEDSGGGQAAVQPAEDAEPVRTAAGADTGGGGDAASEAQPGRVAAERAAGRAHWIDLAAAALADGDNGSAGGDAGLVEAAGFSRQVAQRAAAFDRDAAALAAALTGGAGTGVRG